MFWVRGPRADGTIYYAGVAGTPGGGGDPERQGAQTNLEYLWDSIREGFGRRGHERGEKTVFFNGVVKETALVILTPSLEPCLAPLHPYHANYYAMRNAATYLDTPYVGVFLVAYSRLKTIPVQGERIPTGHPYRGTTFG